LSAIAPHTARASGAHTHDSANLTVDWERFNQERIGIALSPPDDQC
jgi:hypothetical protein